jgi:hypothetical protein
MLKRCALLLWMTPALALAQVQTISLREASDLDAGGRNDRIINILECKGTAADNLVFTWPALDTSGTTGTTLTLWVSSQTDCPSGSTRQAILADADPATASAQEAVTTVMGYAGIDCNTAASTPVYFCAFLYAGATQVSGRSATASIDVDRRVPATPGAPTLEVGDGALNVSWSTASDAKTYQVKAVGGGRTVLGTETSATSQRLTGLANDVTYSVSVKAFSDGGNPSTGGPAGDGFSATTDGTPSLILDFWRRYRSDNGVEEGGCGSGGAGLLALLGLAPLAPRLRRRRP